jgi:prevent-host-death family protein
MEKTISASELKNSLGTVLREVRKDDETVVIEQRGVPAAAIISIEDLQVLREAKEEKRKQRLLEGMRQLSERLEKRQQGMSPEEADRLVEELSDAVMDAVVEKSRHLFEQHA